MTSSDALWSLPEPGLRPALADADLAVLHGVIERMKPKLVEYVRTFAEAAAQRGEALFGLSFEQIEQIEILAEDAMTAFDAFAYEVAAGRLDGPSLEALRDQARLGSRKGTPVEALVLAYNLGAQWFWNRVLDEAAPAERARLDTCAEQILACTQVLVMEVTKASFDERRARDPGEDAEDEKRVVALLAGKGEPHSRWLAVVLRPVPPAGLAALQEARAGLRLVAPGSVAAGHQGAMLVMVPTTGFAMADLRKRISAAIEPMGVIAGMAQPSPPHGVRDACTIAGELAALALRAGRHPGAYGLDALLVDYALERLPELRGHLGDVAVELPAEVQATVERWLALRESKTVANELHVHPNTVRLRMRRAFEITGIDPTSTGGALFLHAALAAKSMAPQAPRAEPGPAR